ncbi:TPA: hypothetical protein SAN82_001477 [Pseudomonas putida]|nr:hypothetical protein [Pseudomonas putida]
MKKLARLAGHFFVRDLLLKVQLKGFFLTALWTFTPRVFVPLKAYRMEGLFGPLLFPRAR